MLENKVNLLPILKIKMIFSLLNLKSMLSPINYAFLGPFAELINLRIKRKEITCDGKQH